MGALPPFLTMHNPIKKGVKKLLGRHYRFLTTNYYQKKIFGSPHKFHDTFDYKNHDYYGYRRDFYGDSGSIISKL